MGALTGSRPTDEAASASSPEASIPSATEDYARARARFDGLADHLPCNAWMREARFATKFFEELYGAEIARLREKLGDALAGGGRHRSDCAVHNAPAFEPGPCNCGAAAIAKARGEKVPA